MGTKESNAEKGTNTKSLHGGTTSKSTRPTDGLQRQSVCRLYSSPSGRSSTTRRAERSQALTTPIDGLSDRTLDVLLVTEASPRKHGYCHPFKPSVIVRVHRGCSHNVNPTSSSFAATLRLTCADCGKSTNIGESLVWTQRQNRRTKTPTINRA